MQSFSIRNIELLTGIKAHTLRIWEQRYDFFKAPRKESMQRVYSNEDLKKLLCIAFLYHNGWKISKIASLPDDEIPAEVDKISLTENNYQSYHQKLLQAAIDFDEASFIQTLNLLIDTIGFEKTIQEVCYTYLNRVGLLWNTNKVIPAQEHFSSYLIQNRLITETETYTGVQNEPPEILLFCPENEHHELPLLYINYLLRKYGWRVLYLGKNIRLEELKEAAGIPGIQYLYLHLITNFTGFSIDDYFEILRKTFPDKIILASGRGIEASQRNFVDLKPLRRDEEIYEFIRSKAQTLGRT